MPPQAKAILCLCHDTTTLQVRKLLLEHFGYKVLATDSVGDAKQLAAERCPDLLLMDNGYPAMDYEEVAAQIKLVCPAVLAVVLSPYFATRPGGEGQVDRFISDDESPEFLAAQIQELLGERQLSEGGTEGQLTGNRAS